MDRPSGSECVCEEVIRVDEVILINRRTVVNNKHEGSLRMKQPVLGLPKNSPRKIYKSKWVWKTRKVGQDILKIVSLPACRCYEVGWVPLKVMPRTQFGDCGA